MIKIGIATLFPAMCEAYLSESIIGNARDAGAVEIFCRDIRDFSTNKHKKVDDKAYGGGTGMVMKAQPIYDCVQAIKKELGEDTEPLIIYMSPQGRKLDQETVKTLAARDSLILLCGHYEGVDQRVLDELGVTEISVGDFVVTGGELPALMLADAVSRLQEGVLPNEDAYTLESHYNGLLEYPQYTRPEEWMGRRVPAVLVSGHHANIKKWQEEEALRVTREKRPDLLEKSK